VQVDLKPFVEADHRILPCASSKPREGVQQIGVQQVDAIALVRKQVEAGLSTCRLVGFHADETCKPRSRLQLTVATDKLAAGIAVGVPLSGVFFTFKVSRLLAVTTSEDEQLT
jgi:hypothetical protein